MAWTFPLKRSAHSVVSWNWWRFNWKHPILFCWVVTIFQRKIQIWKQLTAATYENHVRFGFLFITHLSFSTLTHCVIAPAPIPQPSSTFLHFFSHSLFAVKKAGRHVGKKSALFCIVLWSLKGNECNTYFIIHKFPILTSQHRRSSSRSLALFPCFFTHSFIHSWLQPHHCHSYNSAREQERCWEEERNSFFSPRLIRECNISNIHEMMYESNKQQLFLPLSHHSDMRSFIFLSLLSLFFGSDERAQKKSFCAYDIVKLFYSSLPQPQLLNRMIIIMKVHERSRRRVE